jgi:probable HAF family extracellular repeat protein
LIVIAPIGGSSFDASGCSDVNDLGLVVGRNSINGVLTHFEWTASGGFRTPTHLPPFLAERRVNNRGDSVSGGTPHLVMADGALVPIPDPLGGVSTGQTDLNDALRVIGHGVPTGTSSGVFTWTASSGSTTVAIPAARFLNRINAHGRAVGHRLINGTDRKAFMVDLPTQAWIDLHSMLPGVGRSEALDINDHDVVVGYGPSGGSAGAFVWSATTGFVFLPGLAGGSTLDVGPRAIDNRGRVVGTARTGAGDYHAFLWDPAHGMLDLDALVGGGSFRLVEALDLSETGVIIGRGFYGGAWGPDRGFILNEPVGVKYCAATQNSAGCAAAISAVGSASLSANRLTLSASCLPASSFLFFHGPTQTQLPFANGFVCVSGGLTRIPPLGVSIGGLAQATVDLQAVGITAVGQRNFQCWFRDPSAGGANTNTSDALAITFVP